MCYTVNTMKMEFLNPYIRYAAQQNTYYPPKENSVCYDCRLFYIVHGEGKFFVNDRHYAITNNTLIFLPPKSCYRFFFENLNQTKIAVLNFDLTGKFCQFSRSLGTATESTFETDKFPDYELPQEFSAPIIANNCIPIYDKIANCIELYLRKEPYYKYSASAQVKLALVSLLKESKNERSDYKLVQSIQEFIRNNYHDPELNNETIAMQFRYHSYHLNRLMKAHTNKTLREYIIEYRLHIAKNYLSTSTLNITMVAEKTGFSSYTYFIKLFRERIGASPLQYRKTYKNIGF